MSKHASGCFGLGKKMKQSKFWDHSQFPCCQAKVEDKEHLMSCPDENCKTVWEANVMMLEEWMESVNTMPAIQDCIISALLLRAPAYDFTANCTDQVREAARIQTEVGWIHFTEEKLVRQWRDLQQHYYKSENSDKSAGKWAKNLVLEILQLTHAQWVYQNSIQHEKDRRGLKN